eukprot:CAMPEP_0175045300 /NCGR_PEP_ID=MMETSP0052_2-20121109/4328_1 /TAXON_ID=51329 ORGANISM="Polytomella parva, Strain SAG 63-3" /NCGR_SAMPLE_ID=MMETSP0052_2 /ASSEMBLY_ACC=CAM_ASM_000194 /LENGTH=961 /DNA_ID=CAMNT_0016308779 /DNA_START=229 /DNA_END=3114 /DNA_ORIENTATION=-
MSGTSNQSKGDKGNDTAAKIDPKMNSLPPGIVLCSSAAQVGFKSSHLNPPHTHHAHHHHNPHPHPQPQTQTLPRHCPSSNPSPSSMKLVSTPSNTGPIGSRFCRRDDDRTMYGNDDSTDDENFFGRNDDSDKYDDINEEDDIDEGDDEQEETSKRQRNERSRGERGNDGSRSVKASTTSIWTRAADLVRNNGDGYNSDDVTGGQNGGNQDDRNRLFRGSGFGKDFFKQEKEAKGTRRGQRKKMSKRRRNVLKVFDCAYYDRTFYESMASYGNVPNRSEGNSAHVDCGKSDQPFLESQAKAEEKEKVLISSILATELAVEILEVIPIAVIREMDQFSREGDSTQSADFATSNCSDDSRRKCHRDRRFNFQPVMGHLEKWRKHLVESAEVIGREQRERDEEREGGANESIRNFKNGGKAHIEDNNGNLADNAMDVYDRRTSHHSCQTHQQRSQRADSEAILAGLTRYFDGECLKSSGTDSAIRQEGLTSISNNDPSSTTVRSRTSRINANTITHKSIVGASIEPLSSLVMHAVLLHLLDSSLPYDAAILLNAVDVYGKRISAEWNRLFSENKKSTKYSKDHPNAPGPSTSIPPSPSSSSLSLLTSALIWILSYKVLLLRRLGEHRAALQILLRDLNDFDAAVHYCQATRVHLSPIIHPVAAPAGGRRDSGSLNNDGDGKGRKDGHGKEERTGKEGRETKTQEDPNLEKLKKSKKGSGGRRQGTVHEDKLWCVLLDLILQDDMSHNKHNGSNKKMQYGLVPKHLTSMPNSLQSWNDHLLLASRLLRRYDTFRDTRRRRRQMAWTFYFHTHRIQPSLPLSYSPSPVLSTFTILDAIPDHVSVSQMESGLAALMAEAGHRRRREEIEKGGELKRRAPLDSLWRGGEGRVLIDRTTCCQRCGEAIGSRPFAVVPMRPSLKVKRESVVDPSGNGDRDRRKEGIEKESCQDGSILMCLGCTKALELVLS